MGKINTKRTKEWYPHKQFNEVKSCIQKEEGYMTMFACLLFLAIAVLLFLCLDGSVVTQAEARCTMAQTGLGEHLLANYDVPLANRYHLYFTDPRMNEDNMEEKAEEYYEELFSSSSGIGMFSSPLWNLQAEDLRIESYGTMQEREYEYFVAQIEEYMKYDTAKDLLMNVLGMTAEEAGKQDSVIEETVEKLDRNETVHTDDSEDSVAHTLTPSEVAEGNQADSQVQKNNPLQKIRSILEYGMLGMMVEESSLSEQKVSPSLLPFKNQSENKIDISMNRFKNLGNIKEMVTNQDIGQLMDGLKSQGALNSYIPKHFNSYGKTPFINDTVLQYEVEYILGGQNSDKENLEYVVNRLVLLRFALNAAYAFSDEELNAQALSLSAVLTGITGTPEFMEAVKYIILAAVNLIESVTDVDALLEGKKVPLLKTRDSWKTAIDGDVTGRTEAEKGIGYQEYLLILLTLQSEMEKKCTRMQNLMQVNILQEEPSFQIKECRAGVLVWSKIRVKPVFLLKDFLFDREERFQY